MHIHAHNHAHAHTRAHAHTCTQSHTCTHQSVHTHSHSCTVMHMHTPEHVHTCVYTIIHQNIGTHAHTVIHMHLPNYMHTLICTHVYTQVHTPTHTYTHTGARRLGRLLSPVSCAPTLPAQLPVLPTAAACAQPCVSSSAAHCPAGSRRCPLHSNRVRGRPELHTSQVAARVETQACLALQIPSWPT